MAGARPLMRPATTDTAAPETAASILSARPEHSAASPLSVHAMTVAYHRKPVLWNVRFALTSAELDMYGLRQLK